MGGCCSGGSSTSNTVSEFKPPSYTQQPWENLVNNAVTQAGQGLPIYTGQTVAPLSQQAQVGIGQLTSGATQGTPLGNQGSTNLIGTLAGMFSDPYATAANPYIGQNPYLNAMIQKSNQDITDAYGRGTAAQTDAAFARSGAYGGSAYDQMVQQNQKTLENQLAANTNQLLGQNYYNSANLAEQALNRASGSVQQERARQLQAAGLVPSYEANDRSWIQAMMGGGDAIQQYQQQLMNAGQNLFSQFQQAPWQLSDLLGSVLSRASGASNTTTAQMFGPGTTWGQGLLGTGLLGAGLYNMFGR